MTSAAAPSAAGPALRYSTRAGRWVLAGTVLGSGIASLDATVVGIALPSIGRDFHVGEASLQWVFDAYTLSLAGLLLLGGTLGDRYGRRRVFVIGTVWFAVASLLCGLAPNAATLIVARAIQGIGAALLTPGSLAILQASFVKDDRSRAIGAWSGLGGLATAVGPFIGGWLISAVSWRLIFLINLPLAVAVVAISVRHVPESRAPDETGPLDVPGAVTITGALVGITYGLIAASGQGWSAGPVVASLLGGTALLAAFLVIESRRAEPMLPLGVFASRQFSAANAVTFVIYGALGGTLFLLPTVLQEAAGYSPLASGAALLPVTLIMLTLSARSGALAARIGPRLQMSVGPARHRGRAAPVHAGGRLGRLHHRRAAGGARVRVRAGHQRGPADLNRPVGGAGRPLRYRLGGEQRRGPGRGAHRRGRAAGGRRHHRGQLPAPGGADARIPERGDHRRDRVCRGRRARLRDDPQPAAPPAAAGPTGHAGPAGPAGAAVRPGRAAAVR